MDPSAPGWYPDPTGRHERRYWSGIRWSRHVDDGGIRSDDPVDSLERSTPSRETLRSPGQVPTSGSTPPVPPRGPPPPAFDGFGARPAAGRSRLVLAVGAVVVVLLLAGGALALMSDGDGDDDDPTDGSVVSTEQGSDDPPIAYLEEFVHRASGDTIDGSQADCMANNIIGTIGRDRIVEATGLADENPLNALTPDEVVTAIATGFDCLDDASLVDYMAATWNPERFGGIPDEAAPCVFQGFIDGWGRPRVVQVFGQLANPEESPNINELLSADELGVLGQVIGGCGSELPTATTVSPG